MAAKTVAVNLGGSSVWTPYKDLNFAVEAVLVNKDVEAVPDFVAALKRHKPDFSSLLKNPAKSGLHREAVSKASRDGIAVVGQTAPQILPQAVVDEALIISDMFELNELVSLELLLAGEQQQPLFPELTRGLVAVLLYYDGRRALVNALRTLVQVSEGRTWTLGLNPDIVATVTKYTNGLKEEDRVFLKVMDLLEHFDLAKELDVLQRNKALGCLRYRKQVVDMIQETHQSLAEIVFCWACQAVLTKEEAMRVLSYLANMGNTDGSGALDGVTLTLLMALLYVMDVGVLQTCEDTSPEIARLPLASDFDLAVALHKRLTSETATFRVDGIKSVLTFAWALVLRTFSQFPLVNLEAEFAACLEEDEKVLDAAIDREAFSTMQHLVIRSDCFPGEEFFVKRIHGLVTDFIVLVPLKVKELRNQGDETARIVGAYVRDGLTPPANLPRHFERFLELLSDLYAKKPFGPKLAEEYWCPTEASPDSKPPRRRVALFKFLRLSGDLLPPCLFVPYVSLLRSLSGTPQCAHYCFGLLKNNGHGSQWNPVSWDHFFLSLRRYYEGLRQENLQGLEMRHLYRPAAKGISPLEIRGLVAVLGLVETVVRNDEAARTTLGEHPQHAAVALLVGLTACGVPPELKSAFLNALSAFAVSPDMAFKVWQNLEAAQLLPASIHAPGLHTELEEVESRNEEFPVTRAFLNLISTLVDHPPGPATLRGRGLDPYLEFVRERVFLKFHLRAYKHEKEKWEVARLCLEIVEKLLGKCGPLGEEEGHGTEGAFGVLAHILQSGGGFLRLVLLILDEGAKELDGQTGFKGKESFGEATLLSLRILRQTLVQQESFLDRVRNSNTALIVTSLDRLLTEANPSTGRPDYVLVISRYVVHNATFPKHALAACGILLLLSQNGKMTEHLATVYMFDTNAGLELINGFAEALDVEADVDPSAGSEKDWSPMETRTATCLSILRMLLNCLDHPVPNVGHFLLGFDVKRPIAKTTLQEPGVLGSPRTCLHAVLALLDRSVESGGRRGPPSVVELGYRLVYALCASPATSEPTMRYLRTTRDFFFTHLRSQPGRLTGDQEVDAKLLLQQSWLLRCVALELRLTAAQNQRSHVQRLVTVLLEDDPEVLSRPTDGSVEFSTGSFRSGFVGRPGAVQAFVGPVRRKLLKLLDVMDFVPVSPPVPAWEFFDGVELEKALVECEYRDPGGPVLVDPAAVHRRLSEEAASARGPVAFGQKAAVLREIREVLSHVLERNRSRRAAFAKKQVFLAWRQVAEVLVTTCPQDVLGGETKVRVLLEVAQELLRRILEERSLEEVVAPASGVLLVLTAALYHSLLLLPPECSNNVSEAFSFASYSSSLLAILKSLLECLIRTGSGLQRVRANYYTSVLNLLRAVRDPSSSGSPSKRRSEIVLGYGERLAEVVCRDLCSGHEVTQMLAIATLDVVLLLDVNQLWLSYLTRRGYLRHLVDSVVEDDAEIKVFLSRGTGDEAVRSLYLLESKMALFARLATTGRGAQALLENGLLGTLARCEAIDFHPSRLRGVPAYPSNSQWLRPSVQKSYQQTFVPTLRLVLTLTASLGTKHREAHLQTCQFIAAHAEVLSCILRPRDLQDADTASLEEVCLTTGLLLRLSEAEEDEASLGDQRGRLSMLRSRMLSLVPWLLPPKSAAGLWERILQLRITSGVLSFCCSLCTLSSPADRKTCRVLFAPTLSEDGYRTAGPPGLGLLVRMVLEFSAELRRCSSAPDVPARKVDNSGDSGATDFSSCQKRNMEEAALRLQELDLLTDVLERSLFLLWRHLEYFLLRCVPVRREPRALLGESEAEDRGAAVTAEDLNALKSDIRSVLSESFFRQVQPRDQYVQQRGESPADPKFFDALVRRLKRLATLGTTM